MTTKQNARRIAKLNISNISNAEKEWASGTIIDYVSNLDVFKQARSVFVYLGTDTEPNTEELVGLCLGLEKVVAVPKVKGDIMDAVIITPYTNFRLNHWGILEPQSGQIKTDFDLIITPLVAFDGVNRLGHGKGYYDKYMEGCDAFKIGLAFDVQEVSDLEISKFDIPLDMVVTEKQVITKKKRVANNFFGE